MLKKLSLLLCLALLIACSPVSVLNATISKQGYVAHKDIAYGTAARQRLDVYVPDQLAARAPAVLFFYGGSWKTGSKADYLFVGQALAAQGFIAVIADYRLYPQYHFPDFIDDGAQALKWVHHNIGQYGGNQNNIFVAGHSAGAFNAVMLAANDAYLKRNGAQRDWIRGVIGIAGPYDFTPSAEPDVQDVFRATPDAETQPINFVTGPLPPMLLVTGIADDEVRPKNTYNMVAKLKAFHSPVAERLYPGIGHIGIILSLASGFQQKTSLLADITQFVTAYSQ